MAKIFDQEAEHFKGLTSKIKNEVPTGYELTAEEQARKMGLRVDRRERARHLAKLQRAGAVGLVGAAVAVPLGINAIHTNNSDPSSKLGRELAQLPTPASYDSQGNLLSFHGNGKVTITPASQIHDHSARRLP